MIKYMFSELNKIADKYIIINIFEPIFFIITLSALYLVRLNFDRGKKRIISSGLFFKNSFVNLESELY